MTASRSGPRRTLVLLLLMLLGAAALWTFGTRAAPWLWVRLFPVPDVQPEEQETEESVDRETVARALDQAVVTAGGELPPKPGAGEGAVVLLPRGMSPKQLEAALRDDPRLRPASVYVTRSDALLWNLRVFDGSDLLLRRELRPWLPASPPHPPSNPPEVVLLVDLRGDAEGERVLKWKSPLGVVLEPFAPPTLRIASEAAKASRAVVGALRADEPVAEQLAAIPHISAVLMDRALPDTADVSGFLAPLAAAGLTLVDACPRGCFDAEEVQKAGVPLLRVATTLGRDDGPGADAEQALARNLAVQWGYGVVLAPGTKLGLERAEALVDTAKQDGLPIVFVEEAGRMHGLAPLPGG
ncbi:MAG: hypothetical protein KDA24_04245 [Deltaproteobacteria bacterium]|nr:hypothetical protein [Deltaproteobacteria bacterium]